MNQYQRSCECRVHELKSNVYMYGFSTDVSLWGCVIYQTKKCGFTRFCITRINWRVKFIFHLKNFIYPNHFVVLFMGCAALTKRTVPPPQGGWKFLQFFVISHTRDLSRIFYEWNKIFHDCMKRSIVAYASGDAFIYFLSVCESVCV